MIPLLPQSNPFFPLTPPPVHPVRRWPVGPLLCLERDEGDIEVIVTGTFAKGYPATGPSYASGGEPGEPDHFENICAYDETGRVVDLTEQEYERAERALFRWGC